MESICRAKYDDLEEYSLRGVFDYKTVRVFDGDTLHAAICVEDKCCKINCRLLGIEAPEMPSSHVHAMGYVAAFGARDRLVELVTNVDLEAERIKMSNVYTDTTGNPLPSFSDTQLQKIIDEQNTLVVPQGLVLDKKDDFGRYLVYMKSKDGRDVAQVLLEENIVTPYQERLS